MTLRYVDENGPRSVDIYGSGGQEKSSSHGYMRALW